MSKWIKDYWQVIPIIVALVLLAVALLVNLSNFQNLAWYALVAITAVYAWATMLVVRENKRTIREMEQSRLDAVKPAISLQPGILTEDGGFYAFYLINSGGVAKEVKIDIITTNPDSKKALFMTALNKGYFVFLYDIDVRRLQQSGGLVEITMTFKDSYGQCLQDYLSFNFANIKEEGRKVISQQSEQDLVESNKRVF